LRVLLKVSDSADLAEGGEWIATGTFAAVTEQPPAAKPEQPRYGVLTLIAIAVLAAICLGATALNGSSKSADQGPGAEQACKDFVKDRLKAPATANFSGVDHTSSGSAYTVTGDVDAQNSFGAKLRSHFTCVVRDAGAEWKLESLTGIN
jgi:hypothetical protein